jgi:hypothetical protein
MVQPGTPVVLGAALPDPPKPTSRTARLVACGWMTRPDNPLTARVIVNRLWQWHLAKD